MDFDKAREVVSDLVNVVGRVVVGKRSVIKHVIATLIAGGHVLIEGPTGVAKTLLAKSISRAIGGEFRRVQGNPDLLPTDLTGYYIYSLDGSKRFVKGPIFTNILMFDELNRTPTRVQSALLQAMAEYNVSIDGIIHELPKPFHVIATEMPVEEELGVYPLTLTLRDRFWIKCYTTYNRLDEEFEIIKRADQLYLLDVSSIESVVNLNEFVELQRFIDKGVYVDDRVIKYIAEVVNYLRNHSLTKMGPSHRGSIFMYRIAKVLALMDSRDYVIPDDVKEICESVLSHRIILVEEAEVEGKKVHDLISEALKRVRVPKE
ncbi:MAG: MoxR family ATPase [Thermoprotei archaeon]|nr:MAG: MoxR family ATPase [Thermoprotei archaeon]